jgi:hypothetical protein
MHSTAHLPPAVRDALTAGDGLVRRGELQALGIPGSTIDRALRQRRLVPLANGIYTDPTLVAAAGPWELFRLRSRAFVMVSPPNTYAADWSAIALHGLSTFGDPPAVPSVIRPGSRRSGSNRTVYGRTRFGAVPDRWLGECHGIGVVRPAFAAVDIGRHSGRLASLIVTVAALDGGREQLAGALADIDGWSGAARAAWSVRHCDADVESALESAGRLAFITAGLPASRSNVWVGEYLPVFRLDHYWPEQRVGVEADGLGKYAVNPAKAISDEKEREWRIQRMGIRVIRYGWKVALGSPEELAGRVRELLDAPPLPPGRLSTWSNREGRALRGLGRNAPASGRLPR